MSPKKKRTSAASWIRYSLLVIVLAGVIGAYLWLNRSWKISDTSAIQTEKGRDTLLFIEDTVDLDGLVTVMGDLGLQFDASEFRWASQTLGYREFKPGRYEIASHSAYKSFLKKLAFGEQDPLNLTLLPGQFKEELITKIPKVFRFTQEEFVNALNDKAFLDSLQIPQKDVIAYLYPDTYTFYWTTSPQNLIIRLKKEFDKKISEELLKEMEARNLRLSEVLTMASIIQGEAIYSDEMPTISGLYWNRIRIGMPLQADPTVSFALGAKRRLFYADYAVDHPYNTYKIRGLPPGPINNPSIKAIEAAVYPERHEYLYMVATPEGRHLFSDNFAAHQQAAKRWRAYMREKARQQ